MLWRRRGTGYPQVYTNLRRQLRRVRESKEKRLQKSRFHFFSDVGYKSQSEV